LRNINLLTRPPFAERFFVPLLVGCLVFFLIISTSLAYLTWEARTRNAEIRGDLDRIRQQTDAAISRTTPEAMLQQYEVFRAEIRKLREASADWMPAFEAVTGPLPMLARITRMSMDPEARLSADYEFSRLEDAALYLAALEADARIESVQLRTLSLEPDTSPRSQPGARLGSASEAPAVTSPPKSVIQSPIDLYLESLRRRFSEPRTESEALLQSLEWEIEKKRALEQYHYNLPDSPEEFIAGETTNDVSRCADFSSAELEQAMQNLEMFRLQVPDSDAAVPPSPASPEGAESSEEARPYVYRISMEIRFHHTALRKEGIP
jgi:hypothetical protein